MVVDLQKAKEMMDAAEGLQFPQHEEDAKIAEQYEPKLNQASRAVFSKSYEYTRAYREFRKHLHD